MGLKQRILEKINDIRINLLYLFYSQYFIKKHKSRKGECKQCGECCKGCFLLTEGNKCSVYNDRPRWCVKDLPLDKLDIKLRDLKNCGYYWD